MIVTVQEQTMPILSVIIANWNGARFLPRCFQSLRAQSLQDVQVILADNGSTDDSRPLTRRDFPEVDIVEFDANLGYADANNRAAASSTAPYLLFLNNDTHLDPAALATLISVAEARPDVAILAPQQRTYDGKGFLNVGMSVDLLGFPCIGNAPENKVFYADGACLFIRREVFVALGGFDVGHFMFFEDADLCWRAWLWGYRMATVPQAVVFHKAGGTAGSSLAEGTAYATSRSKRRLTHRNQFATILKNYSAPALCVAVPLFVALTMGEVVLLVVMGQRGAVGDAYMPAWRDLLRDRARIRAMRRRVQRARQVSDWSILRRMEWRLVSVSRFIHMGMPNIK